MSQGLNPSEGKRFLSSAICPDWVSVTHPASDSIGTRLRCTVDHSPPCWAKAKNKLSYTSALLICLHGVGRENFYSYSGFKMCQIYTNAEYGLE
jgi:hypothetical protein